jgi:hypothetical protein
MSLHRGLLRICENTHTHTHTHTTHLLFDALGEGDEATEREEAEAVCHAVAVLKAQ